MVLKIALVVLSCWLSCSVKAQFGQSDSVKCINGTVVLLPYQNRLRADFSFDARRTVFQNRWIAVGGLRAGAIYRRIHRVGLGLYFLNTRVFDTDFPFDVPATEVEYEFGYATLYYERVLFFNRKWEAGANVHLGGGQVRVFYSDPANPNERIEIDPVPFSVAEFAVYGEYYPIFWLGFGAGMGMRTVFGADSNVQRAFTAPIVVLNVQLKIVKLARSFFNKDVRYEY